MIAAAELSETAMRNDFKEPVFPEVIILPVHRPNLQESEHESGPRKRYFGRSDIKETDGRSQDDEPQVPKKKQDTFTINLSMAGNNVDTNSSSNKQVTKRSKVISALNLFTFAEPARIKRQPLKQTLTEKL